MIDEYWKGWMPAWAIQQAAEAPLDAVQTAVDAARAATWRALEKAHKEELARVFKEFARAGNWMHWRGAMEWTAQSGNTFGDDFPITIRFKPKDLRRAYLEALEADVLEGNPDAEAVLRQELAEWRKALDAAERALNKAARNER